jgi:hypothetical protein
MDLKFILYFSIREARVKNPEKCVEKIIDYYVYIISSKDIFPSLKAQIKISYNLCSFILHSYVKFP